MPLSRITSASIANSAISAADIADGTITAVKIISVANTQITGNIVSSQIAPSVTLTTPLISGNLNFDANGTSGIRLTSANTITFHTTGTEDMRIDATGNVGIGTSSPTGKLDVSSSSAGVTAGDLVVDTANKTVYVGRQSSTGGDNSYLVVRGRVNGNTANQAVVITGDTTAYGTGLFRPNNDQLGFSTLSTERMRISSAGYVTTPYQPAFYAYMNSGGSTSFASIADIVFDTVQQNTGSNYSTSTGRFTAPVAGWYHFSTTVLGQSFSNGTTHEIGLTNQTGGLGALGGRQVYQVNYTGTGGYIWACASCTIYMNVGDFMRVTNNGGSSIYINSGPWATFNGHFIG